MRHTREAFEAGHEQPMSAERSAHIKRWAAGIVAVVAVVAAVAAIGVGSSRASSKEPVVVATAQASAKQVSAAGVIAGRKDRDVYPAVDGTVERVMVRDQQRVHAGDALVVLDDRPYAVAKAQALSAVRQARVARARARTTRDRLAARSALAAARLAYAKARHDLKHLTVRAPIDGVVFLTPDGGAPGGARDVVVGQGVSPAAPLLRVIDTSALKFVADVDQDDIALVKSGQKAVVTLDALPDDQLDATTTFVSLVSRTSRSGATVFRVEASLPSDVAGVRIGMEGTAGIGIGGSSSAVRIPQKAVVRRDGAAVVFVVSEGVARLRKVTLGPAAGSEYEVTSGVAAGEGVATSGLADLADGSRVVTD